MWKELQKRIDEIKVLRPQSTEALDRFNELLEIVHLHRCNIEHPKLEREKVRIKAEEGFPLFPKDQIPFDLGCALGILEDLILRHAENHDMIKDGIKKLKTDLEEAKSLFYGCIKDDQVVVRRWAEILKVSPEKLQSFSIYSLKPSIYRLREKCTYFSYYKGWEWGYCPFCGSEPDISCFKDNGKRFLHCSLCGHQWEYPRVNCPFCQNKDQESLGYFFTDEEGLRVDFCKKCSRYIKNIDRRILKEEFPLELEFISTLYLDYLAQKEGFK